jgi:hypothetical protein
MQISNIYNRFATSYIVVTKPSVFLTLMIYYMLLASLSLYRASVRWFNVNQVASPGEATAHGNRGSRTEPAVLPVLFFLV